eukprot:1025405-Ditylum_brightwellii.AAC.1
MTRWHHCWCHERCCCDIVTIRQPCPIRDTANTAPKTAKSNPLSPKNNRSTTISCGVPVQAPSGRNCPIDTATMSMLHRGQPLLPLSWSQNQEMTTMMQGSYGACQIAAGTIAPLQHRSIGSIIWVGKIVGETWEERWCKKG